jgi:hypothetical protein
MEDSLVQQAGFAQTDQWRNGELFVIGITLEVIDRVAQLLAEGTHVVFNFRAFRALRIVKTVYAPAMHKVFINPVEHDVRHLRIADKMIAVVTVLIELMKIDIIQTGAAVQHAVINDKSFEMQHAQRFAGIHRHAVNGHIDARIFLRRAAVPVSIGV